MLLPILLHSVKIVGNGNSNGEFELDAFEVDQVIFHYSRAAKELWKFCNLGNVEITARFVREDPPRDWWERAAPKAR